MKTTKKIYVNGVTLAEAAGVKPAFVTQCKAHGYFQGAIRKKRDSYLAEYHREKCLAILADLDPAKQRKGGEGNGLYVEERGKLIRAQRRRLEFDEKVKKGLYISAEAAKAESVTAGRVLRDCLLNLPGKLSAVVAAKSKKAEKQIFQILRTEINKGLNEAIESLKKIGGDDESADI